jgi:glutamate-ammonia-ligase adenylyltransferase
MSADAFANCEANLPGIFAPARAQCVFEELCGALDGIPGGARRVFESAFGNSPYLARLAARERALLHELWERGPLFVFDSAMEEAERASEAADEAAAMAMLRRAKRCASLGIALSDIAGLWKLDAVTTALTRFADASTASALRFLLRKAAQAAGLPARDPALLEAESGLVILAMGKAGAHELNYSSDLDLVAFYDAERFPFQKKGDVRGAAVDLVKGLVRLLGEITSDGYVFRIDLRLRPDAGATQIAISTEAAERYYEEMGQNWERAAFIKARSSAGDRAAAEEFLKHLEPFVWRRSLDYAAIEDIHSIKRQIHAHGGHRAIAAAGHNVKLGRGGIREIEFFVQTQQLILGGRDPSLRARGTLDALGALRARKLITGDASDELAECYKFLRRLEHRLQMIDDEQTHTVPKGAEDFARIACFSGYPNEESFTQDLVARLRCVEGHYDGLFQKSAPLGGKAGSLVFTGVEDDPETIETLGEMGFGDPRHVAGAVRGWHHGRIRATRSARARELLTRLVPALLEALGTTADPDSAFAQFDRFVTRLPAGVQLFSLLVVNPHLLQLLATIMGSAPRVADHLARSPTVLDSVFDPNFLSASPSRDAIACQLAEQMSTVTDHEAALDVGRRFAREQMFRIGLQLLDAIATPQQAASRFTDVAECVIAALLARVENELAASAGAIDGGAFCVVAMGKLGGREMTATSDLDLIFVYDAPERIESSIGPRPLPVMEYYARLAQRLISALTVFTPAGGLYEVDMRLRPTGNKGPVAVSLQAFARYHTRDAWTWERLALTRARVVAGSSVLRAEVEKTVHAALSRPANAKLLARDARQMRDRLALQFPGKDRWDLKFAPGGLVDIEFVAQYLQLLHAGKYPDILCPGTVPALERLALAGLLTQQDAAVLGSAARLQLALIQSLRLSLGGTFDPATATSAIKALLARAGGVSDFDTLNHRLADLQARARAVFEELLPN